MDMEKDKEWLIEYRESIRKAFSGWTVTTDCKDCQFCRRKVEDEEKTERRAKRREERRKIKEKIRKQKKVWKLAQDRAWAVKIKERRYRKKMRVSRRKKVKWLKKRNWIPMRIFILIFWIRPMNIMCDAPQVFHLGLLSIEFHVSISRSRKKKKKISS